MCVGKALAPLTMGRGIPWHNHLCRIVCQNRTDQALIARELKDKQKKNFTILTRELRDADQYPPPRLYAQEQLQQVGLKGWLDEALEAPETVLAAMRDAVPLHIFAVGDRDIDLDAAMQVSALRCPPRSQECVMVPVASLAPVRHDMSPGVGHGPGVLGGNEQHCRVCTLPSPPLANSHPVQSPPPPPGDRHFHVFLVNVYCVGLCCPSALHMALHCFPIASNQAPVCVL